MGRLTELIPRRFAQECATAGFLSTCKSALGELAAAESLPTALGVLGGVVGGPLAFLGIYAGGAFLQWKADERKAESAKAEFRELHRRLGRIEDGVNEQKELAGLLEELLKRDGEMRERLKRAEKAAKSPEAAFESVLDSTLTQLTKDTDENFENVRIFLSNISTWVVEGFKDIKEILLSGRAQLPTIPAGVLNNLAAAGVSPNPDFVGRADLLVRLHAALASEGVAARTHALSADGGVGKTETAIAYVFDAEFAPTWAGVWWLDAAEVSESEHRIEDELLRTRLPDSLRQALGVMGYQPRTDETPDEMLTEFVRRLGSGRHLVVLDNVDSVEVLRRVCLPNGSRLLVTTRLGGKAIPSALATTIEVDLLEPEESARLLVMHRKDLKDPETGLPTAEARPGVMAIVEHLDGHALAVALAASALRYDEGESPESLLERLRAAELGQDEHAYAELHDDATGRKYGRKVAATLLLHLPELEKQDPLVGPVLLAASVCHNQGIPAWLLAGRVDEQTRREWVERMPGWKQRALRPSAKGGLDLPAVLTISRWRRRSTPTFLCLRGAGPTDEESQRVRKVLLMLRDRSIIRFDETAGVEKRGLVSLHRLTQSAVRGRAGEKAVRTMTNLLVSSLLAVLDDCSRPDRWPTQSEAFLHARSILSTPPVDTQPRAVLLSQLAFLTAELGRPVEAELLCAEALAMRRRLFKGNHPDVAQGLNNLADVKLTLGRAAEAEPLYEESLTMNKCLFKGDHTNVAIVLNNLAGVRRTLDRAAEAEPLDKEALAMHKRLIKGDHAAVATSLSSLANTWHALGCVDEAEPLYEEALAMRRRLFRGDNPDVAQSLNNVAGVRQTLGRADEAEPLLEEALAMYKRLFKGDHPDVAGSLNNLANVRAALGKWKRALGPIEDAVAMGRRCLPEGHPSLVLWEQNLAAIRQKLGRE